MAGCCLQRHMSGVEALKEQAGIAACDFVKDGMKLGLGTGSTVRYTVLELGRRMKQEGLEIVGVPTSCLLYTSPSPRDLSTSRMPSSA